MLSCYAMTNQITHFVLYVFEMEMMMFLTDTRKISYQNNFFVKRYKYHCGSKYKYYCGSSQRWSPRGRPWLRRHILKSLALMLKFLASELTSPRKWRAEDSTSFWFVEKENNFKKLNLNFGFQLDNLFFYGERLKSRSKWAVSYAMTFF